MTPVTITITGPGMSINHELHWVKKALEELGYKIEVENDDWGRA